MARPETRNDRRDALDALVALHAQVDAQVEGVADQHAGRLQCRRGCAGCCVDDITVFAVEAERIRDRHEGWLADATAHDTGACAFLDADGSCRIYAERPYVCRTQGLPMRWLEAGPDGGGVERRDICPENEPGPAITDLPEDDCWTIGPTESTLATIAARFDRDLARIPLRSLFGSR